MKLYLKKPWKPPFLLLKLCLIFTILINQVSGQNSSNADDSDLIEINVEKTSYSLAFSINNTEDYELQNVTCKNGKNIEIVGNENHVCEGLDACTQYFAVLTVKPLDPESLQILEITREEETEYKKPLVVIEKIETFAESVNMTWSATDRTCILNYQIEAKSIEKESTQEFKWTIANNENYLLMGTFRPCKDYNIQLKTYDVYNQFISNQTTNTTTEYEEPGNVKLNIVEHDNAQIKVSWDPVTHATCVKYFYLKWFIQDCTVNSLKLRNDNDNSSELQPDDTTDDLKCEWTKNMTDSTEINANEYIISGLQGCENYGFQIFINNNETINSEQTFQSPEQIPSRVVVKSTNIGNSTIKLEWNPPVQHNKCVREYFVLINGPLQRPLEEQNSLDTSTGETDAFFEQLDPCGQYNYSIFPKSLNGSHGEPSTSSFETLEGKPSPVRNYVVVAEPFALNISWEPPQVADLCVTGYRLSGWDDENKAVSQFDNTTAKTTVYVDGLNACMAYTVQIIPTTKSMMDGELLHIEYETSSIVAAKPDVEVTGIYSNRFGISARDSDLNNKCETIFARIVCEALTQSPIMIAEKYVKGQLVILFNAEIGPLTPFTDYVCNTSLYNIAGWSPNNTFKKTTKSFFPNIPEEVSLKTLTNYSLSFSWTPPLYPNGNINLYILYFLRVEAAYKIPSKCNAVSSEPISRETSFLELSFYDLQPYTRYSIQVAAKNEFGIGEYTSPNVVITKPSVSDPITNLKTEPEGPLETELEYNAFVLLTWNSPCKSNGEIEYFLLEFNGERQNHEPLHFQREYRAPFDADGILTYNETNLLPEYKYNVLVKVKTTDVDSLSLAVRSIFDAPAGIPQRLGSEELAGASVDAYENSNPSKTAIVRFPANILESDSGTIIYVALLLSQKDCGIEPQMKYGAINTTIYWPTTKSWNEVYEDVNSDCVTQYQTTPLRWSPQNLASRSNGNIEFVIGTDDCMASSNPFCNGPLKPDTEYNLIIRLFTNSGYNDAAALEFKTDALINLTIILAGVSSCFLFAFIAGFIYLYVTKRIKWQRESCHGIEDSFGDIIAKNFAIFYRDLSKPEKIGREFKELTAVALDLSYSASELGYNKNRYADIFPYDKNRVILDIDADGSDYINGSFIDGYRRRKEYIATQGPKPESTTDFWRMVLQHNVRVIVMVTQFREGDIIKCHEYFPFKSKGINVAVKKKDVFDLYDRSELSVTHETFGLKQKVIHFYFKKWPDHGCPTDPMHLITFIRKVKVEKIPSYSPIVVHCSAGVGRTGTFIGLDIIMQRLKNESKINIYETVKKLRFQRMKMVQTLAQYTFLYTCTYELVKHKNTRSIAKEESKTKKKVSFETDPENTLNGFRNTSQISRNESDLSSMTVDNQHIMERPHCRQSNDTLTSNGTNIPIRFSGIVKAPTNYDSNDESFM